MKQINVFPECFVDTNLIGFLLGCVAKHKSSCNEVVKAVNKSDSFAIGIIDADKRLASMDKGFHEYIQQDKADGKAKHITMYFHEDERRYMFTIKPAMDKFIFDACLAENVDLKAEGFPLTLEEFKKRTKKTQAAEDPNLRRLFDKIKNYPELQCFRNVLKYLINYQDKADSVVAKQFFEGTLAKEDLQRMVEEKYKIESDFC